MDIGHLRNQVQLQRAPSGVDAEGQRATTWSVLATLWADIKHLSGLQAIRGGAEASVVKASIRIRWRADVAAGDRIVWGSTAYLVEAVLPDAAHRYQDLACVVVK